MNAKTFLFCVLFFVLSVLFCFAQEQGRTKALGQRMSAGGLDVIWVEKPMGEENPENMIWKDGRVYSKNDKPCFVIDVDVVPFDFCILPSVISTFDKIGSLEQYNFTRLNAAEELAARKAHVLPSQQKYLSRKPYVMLYQNQIIILRRGKKCVAFKPVEVITRDRSWEEAPKGCQYTGTTATTFDKNGKTIKIKIEKEHASPIWKSIIYEWKILSPDSHKEILSATNYEASQGSSSAPFAVKELIKGKGWMVILGDYERPFYIPGVDSAVKFSFSKDLKENEKEIQERIKNVELSEYFWEINYEISVCLVNKAGIASTEDGIEKIKDPSLYNFHKFGRMMRFWPIFTESSDTYTILEPDDCLRMTTIFKLDNRYVAIRLLKIENGQVFYQWKYWPLILSETEITDQKQAKQQADEEEANQKSGVKKSRMMAEKSSYLAGMSFSWEVPQKPEQESVVLSYEVKLKSIERVEFALVKEGEIRDIKYSSLSQYGFTIPAEDHGKTEVKLNTVVIFKINDKCVILKPKKIENSSLGNAVIYDWKILGEKR